MGWRRSKRETRAAAPPTHPGPLVRTQATGQGDPYPSFVALLERRTELFGASPRRGARAAARKAYIYIYIYFNFNFNFNYSILTNRGYVTVSIFVNTAIYLLRATIPISGGHTKLPSVSFPAP